MALTMLPPKRAVITRSGEFVAYLAERLHKRKPQIRVNEGLTQAFESFVEMFIDGGYICDFSEYRSEEFQMIFESVIRYPKMRSTNISTIHVALDIFDKAFDCDEFVLCYEFIDTLIEYNKLVNSFSRMETSKAVRYKSTKLFDRRTGIHVDVSVPKLPEGYGLRSRR